MLHGLSETCDNHYKCDEIKTSNEKKIHEKREKKKKWKWNRKKWKDETIKIRNFILKFRNAAAKSKNRTANVLNFWFANANNSKSVFPLKNHFDGKALPNQVLFERESGCLGARCETKKKTDFIIRKCFLLIHSFYRIIIAYTDYMVILCVDVIKIS